MIALLRKLLSREKWEIVYSTHNLAKYSGAKAKLSGQKIRFKTEFISSGGGYGGGYGFGSIYHVLVSTGDVDKANHVLKSDF